MEKRSILKKVAETFDGSESPTLGCELPETPGLKLPIGKISTATRKQLLPFSVHKNGAPAK
jgi:hypothetical protein